MRCAASALAVARIDGSDLRAHVGEVDDAGDEGDDVEEDHAHAHRRQCEKGECESDAEEDDPELLALLVHGTVVLVLEAEAVDEGPELDDECGHRQGKKDETLKARDVFHSLTLAMTAAPSSPGRRILGNCPRPAHDILNARACDLRTLARLHLTGPVRAPHPSQHPSRDRN